VAVDGVKPLASCHVLLIPREKPSLLTKQQAGKNTFGFVLKEIRNITLSIITSLPSSDFICKKKKKKKEY
jgi:hypothetical protein